MAAQQVTEQEFQSLISNSDTPVLVDFWAPWCGPCRMLGPILDELSEEYKGRVKIVKVNVDDNPNTAASQGIRGVPTVKIFNEGKEVFNTSGAQPKQFWVDELNKL